MDSIKLEELIAYENISVVDAMEQINQNAKGILLITDSDGVFVGTLTDGDIRRWIIKTGNLHEKVNKLMNTNPRYLFESDKTKAYDVMTSEKIHLIPILDTCNKIVEVISDDKLSISEEQNASLQGVPVIIMAGGKGSRLRPYTTVLPKPLIPVGDVPIAQRIIEKFTDYSIDKFYITINYRGGIIRAFFDDLAPTYQVKLVEEDKPLGTAGSIRLVEDKIDRPFFVSNCDILINADYAQMYEYHIQSGNALTAVAAVKNIDIPYGVLVSGENGTIKGISEKPRNSYLINTGMYIVNPEIINMIPNGEFFHMTDLIELLIRHNYKVGMFPIGEEDFLDMGQFEEMKKMDEVLLSGKN